MSKIITEFKDRLFTFIFGRAENREWTLDLYNAMNGTHYADPEAIQINTIREVLYLSMRNDVSFLLSEEMNLYEQQSTFNPNMPVRQLQYCGYLYEKYIKENSLKKYGGKILKLPVPKLVVFYNGKQNEPDDQILRLSDSFPPGSKGDIEVCVRMVNINYGRSPELLAACRPLNEYSWFVAEVRSKGKTMSIEDAVDSTISSIPGDFVLKPFFTTHRVEVRGMMLMEYDEEEAHKQFKEEGFEEGRENTLTSIARRMTNQGVRVEAIADFLGITIDKVKEILQAKPTV